MNISWTNMNIITSILQQQRWAIHVKEDQRKKQVWIQTDPTQQAMKEKFWQSFKTRKERRKCVISRLLKSDQGSSIFMETKERTGRSQLPIQTTRTESTEWKQASREKCLVAALSYAVLMWFKISSKTEIHQVSDIETFFKGVNQLLVHILHELV